MPRYPGRSVPKTWSETHLEDMTVEQLEEFYLAYEWVDDSTPYLFFRCKQFSDGQKPREVLRLVTNYARAAAVAKKLRLEGQISQAQSYEDDMEFYYGRLPPEVKW